MGGEFGGEWIHVYVWQSHLLFTWNYHNIVNWLSVQFSSVPQSCPTLCHPMDCSTPSLPVHQQLPEFTQTRFHWVRDAIKSSHPLSSPSPPAFNLSQHQGLFKWVSSSQTPKYWVSTSTSVLPMNIQDWFPLGLTGLISLGVIIWHLPGLLVFWTGLFQGWVSDSSCPINIITKIFSRILRNY